MLTREAVAAALALAGIRTGAHVLDLTPDAGLTRAARAMAGSAGRVDTTSGDITSGGIGRVGAGPAAAPPVRYSYALGIWSDRSPEGAVDGAASALDTLAPYARVTVGSAGSLAALVDTLRSGGWTVLHATTVPDADPALPAPSQLALAVARRPE